MREREREKEKEREGESEKAIEGKRDRGKEGENKCEIFLPGVLDGKRDGETERRIVQTFPHHSALIQRQMEDDAHKQHVRPSLQDSFPGQVGMFCQTARSSPGA
jgi:hypothetical protein